jgi:glycosyltransferase involved in cell wall biosynthesis
MPPNPSSKLCVVLVVSTLGRTGPTRQLLNLARHLCALSVAVHIVTLSPEPNESLIDVFRSSKLTLHSLGLTRLQSILYGITKLKNLITELDPDIIHSQGLRSDALCAYLKHPVKITTQRNNPSSDYPRLYGPFVGQLSSLFHVYAQRNLLVVKCAKSIDQKSTKHRHRSFVIPNGVDTKAFSPLENPADRPQLRERLALPKTGCLFLYTGPLIARKNIAYLIKVFLTLNSSSDHLIILGSGAEREVLRQLANHHPGIHFRDSVADVLPYLRAADYFISASSDEGLPNSVLEALATGLPVLLSDIPSHREILERTHNAGAFFDSQVPQSLSRLISDIPNRHLSSFAARTLARTHFDSFKVAEQYLALYENSL